MTSIYNQLLRSEQHKMHTSVTLVRTTLDFATDHIAEIILGSGEAGYNKTMPEAYSSQVPTEKNE